MTPFLRALADGHGPALTALGEAVANLQTVALQPYRRRIASQVAAAAAQAGARAAGAGIGAMLSALHPQVSWDGHELSVASTGEFSHELDGRVLVVRPSVLAVKPGLSGNDFADTVELYYPAAEAALVPDPRPEAADPALAALLGSTRAAVLDAVVRSPAITTSQLATASASPGRRLPAHHRLARSRSDHHLSRRDDRPPPPDQNRPRADRHPGRPPSTARPSMNAVQCSKRNRVTRQANNYEDRLSSNEPSGLPVAGDPGQLRPEWSGDTASINSPFVLPTPPCTSTRCRWRLLPRPLTVPELDEDTRNGGIRRQLAQPPRPTFRYRACHGRHSHSGGPASAPPRGAAH